MKPLQIVAVGWFVTLLYVRVRGWDAVPDPIGWLLVGLGAQRLPAAVRLRSTVVGAAVLAGVVSLPLVLPPVHTSLSGADPSLGWALSLPAYAVAVLIAHALVVAATEAGETTAARWLRALRTTTLVVALLPALVYGAGLAWLAPVASLASPLTVLWLLWLVLSYAGRPWAGGATTDPTA